MHKFPIKPAISFVIMAFLVTLSKGYTGDVTNLNKPVVRKGFKPVVHLGITPENTTFLRPNIQYFIQKKDMKYEFEISRLGWSKKSFTTYEQSEQHFGLTFSRKSNLSMNDSVRIKPYWLFEAEAYYAHFQHNPTVSTAFKSFWSDTGINLKFGIGAVYKINSRFFADAELSALSLSLSYLHARNYDPSLSTSEQRIDGFVYNQAFRPIALEIGLGMFLFGKKG